MEQLLKTIVTDLVDDKDSIKITTDTPNDDGITVIHLSVAPEDMGRVIGKQGRIAKAIRTVMRAAAIKNDLKISIEIDG
ncbi:MAG: KH domain-containing protein [Oscillospiraceae bacterium]